MSSMVATVLASVVSGAAIQSVVVVRWTGSIDARLSAVIAESAHNTARTDLIPIVQERISSLERSDRQIWEANNLLAMRLDSFVQRVDRLDTPLGKKVEGLEIGLTTLRDTVATLRDSQNTTSATTSARMEAIIKRIDALFDKEIANDSDFADVRQRLSTINEDMAVLKSDATRLMADMDRIRNQPRP
jgi:predicted nuclease with TOPRIM domain